jgi:hypothetical protein
MSETENTLQVTKECSKTIQYRPEKLSLWMKNIMK